MIYPDTKSTLTQSHSIPLQMQLEVELEFVQCLANPAYLNCKKLLHLSLIYPSFFSFSRTGLLEG